MNTECNQPDFSFQALGPRKIIGRFDGGRITSDGGGVLLREVVGRTGVLRELAQCFWDARDGRFVEHSVEELIAYAKSCCVLRELTPEERDQFGLPPMRE